MKDLIERIRSQCRPMQPKPTGLAPRLATSSDIRAVLFDIYGTLIISGSGDIGSDRAEHRRDSLLEVADLFDLSLQCDATEANDAFVHAVGAEHKRLKAKGVEYPEVDYREIWSTVLPSIASGSSGVDISAFAIEFELRVNPTWPMPSVRETLKSLCDGNSVLGIVSNAQFFTPLVLEALLDQNPEQLGFLSSLTYFSFEHRQAKPGTGLYELSKATLKGLGIAPEQVLYVGNDMLNDIYAASQVGFRTALFAGDQRSLRLREDEQRVHGVEADIVVTELEQLTECLPLTE